MHIGDAKVETDFDVLYVRSDGNLGTLLELVISLFDRSCFACLYAPGSGVAEVHFGWRSGLSDSLPFIGKIAERHRSVGASLP